MPTSTDLLFDLISKLTDKEQREIKEQLGAGNSQTEPVLLLMFNALCRMKEYDEGALLKAINRKRTLAKKGKISNSISVHKASLKKIVLNHMATMVASAARDRHQKLEIIHTLYEKGIVEETLFQVALFKKEVIKDQKFSYAVTANFYAIMALEHSQEANVPGKVIELAEESAEYAYREYLNARVYAFYVKAYSLQLRGSVTSDKDSLKKVEDLNKDESNLIDENIVLNNTRRYLFLAKTILARFNADYELSLLYSEKTLEVARQSPKFGTSHSWYNEFCTVVDTLYGCIMARQPQKMKPLIALARQIVKNSQPDNINRLNGIITHVEFNMLLLQDEPKTWVPELLSLQAYYKANANQLQIAVRRVLEFDLATGFFKQADFKSALKYLRAITGSDIHALEGINEKNMIYLLILITLYELLYNVEKGKVEIENFATELRSYSRKIKSLGEEFDTRVEKAFIQCFEALVKQYPDKNKRLASLQALYRTLSTWQDQNLLYLKQMNNMFDLTAWVKQKTDQLGKAKGRPDYTQIELN
jgi:hypothetical protein